jgi:1-phosphatidylinositol-3-phosphate 5-kinase
MHFQEDKITGDHIEPFGKSLPRLPSVDDAYDWDDASMSTPKAALSGLPSDLPVVSDAPNSHSHAHETFFQGLHAWHKSFSSESSTSITQKSPLPHEDPAKLLLNMRQTFQRTEQSLYAQLSRTPISSLNDVRRSFLSAARGTTRRLGAWQGKHLRSVKEGIGAEKLSLAEPEWWNKNCHAVPASNIIVRENEWGSIIAFTLR